MQCSEGQRRFPSNFNFTVFCMCGKVRSPSSITASFMLHLAPFTLCSFSHSILQKNIYFKVCEGLHCCFFQFSNVVIRIVSFLTTPWINYIRSKLSLMSIFIASFSCRQRLQLLSWRTSTTPGLLMSKCQRSWRYSARSI